MGKTLSLLPPSQGKGEGLAFARAVSKFRAPATKPLFSIPKMKQVAKLAKDLGQTVTGFTVNGDGGFSVTTTEPGAISSTQPSEWD
ncbi:hypothetical protein [Pararhizobium qamdonense]|uniref:hypothetical protein n=1 Tax=Pararhizobium qamdonense TaxID=3031126 RepID=UPI0023E2346F|nr:hypothetical protein [Pararhizobium qamdonense]